VRQRSPDAWPNEHTKRSARRHRACAAQIDDRDDDDHRAIDDYVERRHWLTGHEMHCGANGRRFDHFHISDIGCDSGDLLSVERKRIGGRRAKCCFLRIC